VEQIVAKRAARLQRNVQLSWQHSLLGQIESRLHFLALQTTCFAINAEAFDNVLLVADVACIAKENRKPDVKICRQGAKVKWIRVDGLYFCDIKNLLSPGTSLDSLGKMCHLPVTKGIFPWEKFTSPAYLEETRLPADKEEWKSSLQPDGGPSQAMVDEVLLFYQNSGFANVGEYLRHYLIKDVEILQQAVVALSRSFYAQLGINFLGLRKHTISGLANAAAHAFLLRGKRHGIMTCNHSKLYSILKNGLRGGESVCTAFAPGCCNGHCRRRPQVTRRCTGQWRGLKLT
jgi:DNA polymerase type B, organellar and viral